jgi:hypothetical protein
VARIFVLFVVPRLSQGAGGFGLVQVEVTCLSRVGLRKDFQGFNHLKDPPKSRPSRSPVWRPGLNDDTPHPIKIGRLPFSKVRLPAFGFQFQKWITLLDWLHFATLAKAVIYPLAVYLYNRTVGGGGGPGALRLP